MKIVMFSINPLFPDRVTGGASKHLFHIAQYLGGLGHDVVIYCARSGRSAGSFLWTENVQVFPHLPFNLPFPQPFAISGADLALAVSILSEALVNADRFYIHDGEWLLPDIYEHLPTILSFRDNIYPESVLGTFIGKPDDVICVSPYSQAIIEATAGKFFPELRERVWQVNNGIDLNTFSPVDPAALANEIGVNPAEEKLILHPHRPERGKGLPETIRLVAKLVNDHQEKNLKVLIPEWIDEMVSPGESNFYQEMIQLMRDLGVRDHFRFFPWLPNERMPELYSLGDVTLSLGNIVEAFGNVAYESLACRTPSIVANVGVHRSMLPDHLIAKVPFGDEDAAAEMVLRIFNGFHPSWEVVSVKLQEIFNFQKQIEAYAKIILDSRKKPRLRFFYQQEDARTKFRLPPWCYLAGSQIYHDFHGYFEDAGDLSILLSKRESITKQDALDFGVSNETWQDWMRKTWLVSVDEKD